jgi:hypothetical protein
MRCVSLSLARLGQLHTGRLYPYQRVEIQVIGLYQIMRTYRLSVMLVMLLGGMLGVKLDT